MMALKKVAFVVACLVAPVIAVTVGAIAFFAGELLDTDEYSLGFAGAAMVGVWLGIVVGIPTMLLVGVPMHVHFQRRGMTGAAPYALGGALAGGLASLVFMLAPSASGWESWSDMASGWWRLVLHWEMPAKVLIFGTLTGVLAAWIFWLLWLMRRPAANPPTATA
jgi:hypothetical protein